MTGCPKGSSPRDVARGVRAETPNELDAKGGVSPPMGARGRG